ncbi:MAG: hypothetical protein AAF721_38460 [Myxococcota bacterium]
MPIPPRRRGPQRTIEVTPVARNTLPTSALRTEFGRILETVMTVPGVLGVVLSDDGGYAIDYVLDDRKITPIDVQIIGAQLGVPLSQLVASGARHRLDDPVVVLESDSRRLMAGLIAEEYIAAAMLAHHANLALALRRFAAARARLTTLLVG